MSQTIERNGDTVAQPAGGKMLRDVETPDEQLQVGHCRLLFRRGVGSTVTPGYRMSHASPLRRSASLYRFPGIG
jgi:hypothetical protein